MNTMQHMVDDLLHSKNGAEVNSISEANYLEWQKFYTWDALNDQRYGQSFCNHFGVTDYRIFYERDWIRCDTIIRSEWLARP